MTKEPIQTTGPFNGVLEEDFRRSNTIATPFTDESENEFPSPSTSSRSEPVFDGLDDISQDSTCSFEWDIIAEAPDIHSVFSFDSLHFSYKDALTMTRSPVAPVKPAIRTRLMVERVSEEHVHIHGAHNQDTGEAYDSFFILDGYKRGRGKKSVRNDGRTHKQDNPYRTRENRNSRRRSRHYLKESVRKY